MALVIPSERSADGPPQREESSYRQVGRRPSVGEEDRANVIDRSGGSTVIEWNRPDVMQRHVPEKRVAAQVELLELCRIGAHACHRLSGAAPLSLAGMSEIDQCFIPLAPLNGLRDAPPPVLPVRNTSTGTFRHANVTAASDSRGIR